MSGSTTSSWSWLFTVSLIGMTASPRRLQTGLQRRIVSRRLPSRRIRHSPEASLTAGELHQCGLELLGAEFGPRAGGEIQLRVSALPQEEIRQPLLAARSDQQIHGAGRLG